MSDTPNSPPPTPIASRNSPLAPKTGSRLDPAALAIGIGGAVLLLAVWWLLTTPRQSAEDNAQIDKIDTRLAALEGGLRTEANALGTRLQALETLRTETGALGARVQALGGLEGRVQAVETKPVVAPPVNLAPLEREVAAAADRAVAAERAITAAAAQLGERLAAMERRLIEVEARPSGEAAAAALRGEFATVGGRLSQIGERIDALAARVQAVDAEALKRATAAEQALAQRVATLEAGLRQSVTQVDSAAQQKLAATESTLGQRLAATDTALGQRIAATETTLGQKIAATEAAIGQRIGAVEQEQKKLAAVDSRTQRLVVLERIRGNLGSGQPLGDSLAGLNPVPPALARFATAAPPTEFGLRLAFEEAAAKGRAASDPAVLPDGSRTSVVEGALSRLGGLVTVRRGEQVIWGDAAQAEIERARRALEAGDIEGSLSHLDKLPPPPKAAMKAWVEQARALLAARAALRQLAVG